MERVGEVAQRVGHIEPAMPKGGFNPNPDFKPDMPNRWVFKYIMPSVVPLLLIVIGTVIKMYAEWRATEETKKEIAAKKLSSELQLLKAQLNPHFLFNSLNTIYSLSVKQSTETSDAVINLSEMMRYMLYEADKELVPLEKELDYLHNYIYLQRLRLANDQEVTSNIHGDYYHKKIQPLLFVSFVENAFKYGTDFTGKTKIKIVIGIKDDSLTFFCENVIGRVDKDKRSSGIGLENTKSRLKLLYPGTHDLTITNENGKFTVNLFVKFNKS
ncbi:sensor histidine kinase [Neptunitalea chrysea]|nr:sensor histidine kinase [Neptunitalea chrysea]